MHKALLCAFTFKKTNRSWWIFKESQTQMCPSISFHGNVNLLNERLNQKVKIKHFPI